jgi:hypothetical protein
MSALTRKGPNRRGPILSAPIRADVRLTNSEGFTRRFQTWNDVSAWLASPEFIKGSPAISSMRLINQASQGGGDR